MQGQSEHRSGTGMGGGAASTVWCAFPHTGSVSRDLLCGRRAGRPSSASVPPGAQPAPRVLALPPSLGCLLLPTCPGQLSATPLSAQAPLPRVQTELSLSATWSSSCSLGCGPPRFATGSLRLPSSVLPKASRTDGNNWDLNPQSGSRAVLRTAGCLQGRRRDCCEVHRVVPVVPGLPLRKSLSAVDTAV